MEVGAGVGGGGGQVGEVTCSGGLPTCSSNISF